MKRDLLGSLLSLICILHCLSMPALLAWSGAAVFGGHWFHEILLLPVVLLIALSFPQAFFRHGSVQPLGLGMAGLGLLAVGLFTHGQWELLLSLAGGVFVVSAHWLNRRLLLTASS